MAARKERNVVTVVFADLVGSRRYRQLGAARYVAEAEALLSDAAEARAQPG